MRTTSRAFLSAILLTALAGAALAQEAGTVPPPSSVPAAEKPAKPDALPPLPFVARPMPALPPAVAPDVQPALTAEPIAQTPPVSAPVATVAVVPPATKPMVKPAHHVAKKSAKKPETKPLVASSQSFESVTTEATATTAAVAPPAAAAAPPVAAAASTAPVEAVKPPPPAANPAVVENTSDTTKSETTMGVGGWVLFGIGVVLAFAAITVIRRRRALAQVQPSIMGFVDATAELAPVLVRRP